MRAARHFRSLPHARGLSAGARVAKKLKRGFGPDANRKLGLPGKTNGSIRPLSTVQIGKGLPSRGSVFL